MRLGLNIGNLWCGNIITAICVFLGSWQKSKEKYALGNIYYILHINGTGQLYKKSCRQFFVIYNILKGLQFKVLIRTDSKLGTS